MPTYDEEHLEEWTEEAFDAPAVLASYMQGYEPLSKQSTRYVAIGSSIATCNVDLGQYGQNLTIGTGSQVLFQSLANGSIRFDFSHPRVIGFRVTMTNTDTGTLFRHGAATSTRVRFLVAGTLQLLNEAAVVGSYAPPGLSATPKQFVFAWVSEANPDSTGAADAVRSWLHAWCIDDGTYDHIEFTHAVAAARGQTAFFGAADNTPTSPFTGTITGILFEGRCMPPEEIEADWVLPRLAPATEVDEECEHEGISVEDSLIHGDGNFHGPPMLAAADKSKRLTRRLLSPLWNERFRSHPTRTDALLTTSDPKIRAAPGNSDYRMHIGWLRCYPVPDTCSHLWVRMHVFARALSGTAVPCGLRLYSMNRPPGPLGVGEPEPFAYYYAEDIVTRDDDATVTPGEWSLNKLVPIARATSGIRKGKTYLAIALCVDPNSESTNDANAQLVVRAAHAVPCFVQSQGGFPVAP